MGHLLIRPQAKYCSSDLYMYEVGHGSAEASEEIQASTVYISTQTASDIYQTFPLSENYTNTQGN